jgi:hypothetical protein
LKKITNGFWGETARKFGDDFDGMRPQLEEQEAQRTL